MFETETYPSYGTHWDQAMTYPTTAPGPWRRRPLAGQQGHRWPRPRRKRHFQDNDVTMGNPSGTSSTSFTYDAADLNTGATSTMACTSSNETLSQSFSNTGYGARPRRPAGSGHSAYTNSCSGSNPQVANYSYNAAGRLVYQGTSPQGSGSATFAYDAAGDPTTITNHVSSGGAFDGYTQSLDDGGEVAEFLESPDR